MCTWSSGLEDFHFAFLLAITQHWLWYKTSFATASSAVMVFNLLKNDLSVSILETCNIFWAVVSNSIQWRFMPCFWQIMQMSFIYGKPLDLVINTSHSSSALELLKDGLLNQCSWRNINCAWSLHLLLSRVFSSCVSRGFCWFVYQVSTHLFTYDIFIHSFCNLYEDLLLHFWFHWKEKKYSNTCLRFCFCSAKIYIVQTKCYWLQFCPQKHISFSIPVS